MLLIASTRLSAAVAEYVHAAIFSAIVVFCALAQEYRVERVPHALRGMHRPVIKVLRDGEERETLSREIVPSRLLGLWIALWPWRNGNPL